MKRPKIVILESGISQKINKLSNLCEYEIRLKRNKELLKENLKKEVNSIWKRFYKINPSSKDKITYFSVNQMESKSADTVIPRKFRFVQAFSRDQKFNKFPVIDNNLIPLSSLCLIETKDDKLIFGFKENMHGLISGFSGYMSKKDVSHKENTINLFKYICRTLKEELNISWKDVLDINRIGKVFSEKTLDHLERLNNRVKNNIFLIRLNIDSQILIKKFKKNPQFKRIIVCNKSLISSFLEKNHQKMSIHCIGAIYCLLKLKENRDPLLLSKKVSDLIDLRKKEILITGANGFIGRALIDQLSEKYSIIGVDKVPLNESLPIEYYQGDLKDKDFIKRIVNLHKFYAVIHAAAEKSISFCEKHKKYSYKNNFISTINLYELTRKENLKFIFISSDIVFDGKLGNYSENSAKHAINYYGLLKDICEKYLYNKPRTSICRTSMVFGKFPLSQKIQFNRIANKKRLAIQGHIVDHVISRLSHGKEMVLSYNEYCNPTGKKTLSKQIEKVIEKEVSGIFHLCGAERISKYEFGCIIAETFKLNKDLIKKEKSKDPLRPKDVSLNSKNSQKTLDLKFPNLRDMLLEEYNEDFNK